MYTFVYNPLKYQKSTFHLSKTEEKVLKVLIYYIRNHNEIIRKLRKSNFIKEVVKTFVLLKGKIVFRINGFSVLWVGTLKQLLLGNEERKGIHFMPVKQRAKFTCTGVSNGKGALGMGRFGWDIFTDWV